MEDNEYQKQYLREYYQRNKERILKESKEKYKRTKHIKKSDEEIEKIKEYFKEYYKNNKDKMDGQSANYKKRKRDDWNSYQKLYKLRKYWLEKLEKNPDDEKAKEKLAMIEKEWNKRNED